MEVSDYDRANGIPVKHGSTSYINFPIDREKAVNELIDGYDAQLVPDNLVADRLDSAGYALAVAEDTDGATVLLAGATVTNIGALTVDGIYSDIVDIRQQMSRPIFPMTADAICWLPLRPTHLSLSPLSSSRLPLWATT